MTSKKLSKIMAILCTVLAWMIFYLPVNADTGPKPSVRVNFENMDDELCYGTLLSKTSSTGPHSVWDGDENHIYNYYIIDSDIWRAFAEYEDADGYYFLQIGWKVSETKEIAWTYYPPSNFKILLYYPESGTFAVSRIYEKYAFDSYYTVDMDGVSIGSVDYDDEQHTDERIEAYRSYDYTLETLSLIARIVITVVVEIGIAWFFGFRKKELLLLLVGVNVATQIVLNLFLNVINYNAGQQAFLENYILFEVLVFAIEAVVYCVYIKRISEQPKRNWFYVVYALVANILSFGAGIVVAHILPGIF